MVPVNDPKTWEPYMNTRDCSKGFCSLYCPQWCYIIFPPPPPFDFPEDNSGPSFSPLVIAIIGILASAFLLVSYYAIMSKYCGNRGHESSRNRGDSNETEDDDSDEINHDRSIHDQPLNGLDESLIKSISVFKYTSGAIDGSDCSVCLSEFQENENLRLLPKCSHAFHVNCIDTWLKSHSNCPLCRSNIVFLNPPTLPPPILEPPSSGNDNSAPENHAQIPEQSTETEQHAIVIREDENEAESIRRRSVSLDFSCHGRLSIADILSLNHDEDENGIGSSKNSIAEVEINSQKQSVLSCVMNPAVINRSLSSGRFLFPKLIRGPNTSILPS